MDYLLIHDSYDAQQHRHPLFKYAFPVACGGMSLRDLFYLELEDAIAQRLKEDPVKVYEEKMKTMVPSAAKEILRPVIGGGIEDPFENEKIETTSVSNNKVCHVQQH